MDDCTDRLQVSTDRIKAAGYTNIVRIRGIDARTEDLCESWKVHGSPMFDPADKEFVEYSGKQACALGHYNMWKKMMDENIPYATVFEDDVEFHYMWNTLASAYYECTPKDFDILYLGSQLDADVPGHVSVAPVFCTHAYIITLQGAKKLYDLCLRNKKGTSTIDCMLIDHMKQTFISQGKHHPFVWYVWNGTSFYDPRATKSKDWAKRNTGLVFQDVDFGTFVRPW
jgi:GR25 family glycosyltransferase involved in LPS biosynthesis